MRNEPDNAGRKVVVVGVPGTRRVRMFVEAARRMGLVRAEVLSYLDFLAGRHSPPSPQALVRIESPGECSATTRRILKAGIAPLAAIGENPVSVAEIDRLDCDRGEMLYPRQWYFGFREILTRLSIAWSSESVAWMSAPEQIILTFDKVACVELWDRLGLPVPRRVPAIGSYAQLRDKVRDHHARLFVKLRFGYSALGAVALEWRGDLVRAITTMEIAGSSRRPRLFLSKRPHVLTSEQQIQWLIDTLAREEILVEEWIPKARWNGLPFDLRAVLLGGQMRHVVGRGKASPFTNLNLDARRIAREELEIHLGAAWRDLEILCERAVTPISSTGCSALDVLVRPGGRRFTLLEANAFGDYLPGLLHRGQSIYEAELAEFSGFKQGAVA